MSRRDKGKISTDGGDSQIGDNPFASLNSAGLPKRKLKPADRALAKAGEKKSKGRVEVRREKAGRGGKTVTTLKEFPTHIPLSTLETITFELKKICACGGTLKGRDVVLQGDVCARVCDELNLRGYQAVRAGG
ncbi:translation initiation factor [Puniceicoccaceae bacterium]|nr:translation initiation factor [Puniceicoccaceae bacterium]